MERILDADPVAARVREIMADERNGREAHPTFRRPASMLPAMPWLGTGCKQILMASLADPRARARRRRLAT
jgi:hypothetical protein